MTVSLIKAGQCTCSRGRVVKPKLEMCRGCYAEWRVIRREYGLEGVPADLMDYVACERYLRTCLHGEHLTPIDRRLTLAERIWLVQKAVQAGVTAIDRIRTLTGMTAAYAQRLLDDVQSGRASAPEYDLFGRACA